MIEVTGNLWDYPADVRIITTNGSINGLGKAVMGRGCAKEAALRYPQLPYMLAKAIKQEGNHPYIFRFAAQDEVAEQSMPTFDDHIITFPVKHQWFEHADFLLMRTSTLQLMRMIDPSLTYVMPRPGCGNGKREWSEVRSIVKDLPDNVFIIDFPPKDEDAKQTG